MNSIIKGIVLTAVFIGLGTNIVIKQAKRMVKRNNLSHRIYDESKIVSKAYDTIWTAASNTDPEASDYWRMRLNEARDEIVNSCISLDIIAHDIEGN